MIARSGAGTLHGPPSEGLAESAESDPTTDPSNRNAPLPRTLDPTARRAAAAPIRTPIIAPMRMPSDLQRLPATAGTAAVRWGSTGGASFTSARSCWRSRCRRRRTRRRHRPALARHVYLDTAPILLWFTVLSALISLVLIRIVVVTALQLRAVAVRARDGGARAGAGADPAHRGAVRGAALHDPARRARSRTCGSTPRSARQADPVLDEVLPRVVAGIFAV